MIKCEDEKVNITGTTMKAAEEWSLLTRHLLTALTEDIGKEVTLNELVYMTNKQLDEREKEEG